MTRYLVWLLLIVGFVAGLIFLGRWGGDQLQTDDRYQVMVESIECDAPAGKTRIDFLKEVRYLSPNEDRFSVLEPRLTEHLRRLFELHPDVEALEEVNVEPPRRVVVKLRFKKQ